MSNDIAVLWERMQDRLERVGDCMVWTGGTATNGYGRCMFRGTQEYTHRLAYTANYGRIPAGLEIDHLCRNRSCCNPSHLEAVTHQENVLRGQSLLAKRAAQTHCIHGHPFDAANTYVRPNGQRVCRACKRR